MATDHILGFLLRLLLLLLREDELPRVVDLHEVPMLIAILIAEHDVAQKPLFRDQTVFSCRLQTPVCIWESDHKAPPNWSDDPLLVRATCIFMQDHIRSVTRC